MIVCSGFSTLIESSFNELDIYADSCLPIPAAEHHRTDEDTTNMLNDGGAWFTPDMMHRTVVEQLNIGFYWSENLHSRSFRVLKLL